MKRLMFFFLLMAVAALSAAGQTSSKTAELGWLELPAFSEDPEHFLSATIRRSIGGGSGNFIKCRKDVGKSGNENAPERCQRHFSVVLGIKYI